MTVQVEWVVDPARFAELGRPWNELAELDPFPFSQHEWLISWLEAFAPTAEPAICLLWREGRLAAAMPLIRGRGRRLLPMANVHTPVFRPLARDPDALELIAAELVGSSRRLVIDSIPSGDPSLVALERAAGRTGRRFLTEARHVSPMIDTRGSSEEWERETKPRWRAQLDRLTRKAAREHGMELSLIEPPGDLETELATGVALEASGWKGREGTAIEAGDATRRFYRAIAERFAQRRELRLSTLTLDGAVAAFDLSILRQGRLFLLKTGYDESRRKLAPGLVLHLAVIRKCFSSEIEYFDLLGDDAEWKRKFATGDRRQVMFRSYARGPFGTVGFAFRRAVRPRLLHAYRAARLRRS